MASQDFYVEQSSIISNMATGSSLKSFVLHFGAGSAPWWERRRPPSSAPTGPRTPRRRSTARAGLGARWQPRPAHGQAGMDAGPPAIGAACTRHCLPGAPSADRRRRSLPWPCLHTPLDATEQ
jgi:hypothetical protein